MTLRGSGTDGSNGSVNSPSPATPSLQRSASSASYELFVYLIFLSRDPILGPKRFRRMANKVSTVYNASHAFYKREKTCLLWCIFRPNMCEQHGTSNLISP
jgi:hypothetical protein